MPGKHAPGSSKSFYLSVGASVGGALAALGLVLALVLVALNAGGDDKKAGSPAVSTPPTTKSPSVKPTASVSSTPASTVLPANRVTTAVLNGTKRTGLAGKFADQARKAGYPVLRTGNAPADFAKSTIYYRPDAQDEALAFQKRFPRFTVIAPLPPNYPSDVLLTNVLGADFP
jgi:LytR cell envelope-related transcriptional attenuator